MDMIRIRSPRCTRLVLVAAGWLLVGVASPPPLNAQDLPEEPPPEQTAAHASHEAEAPPARFEEQIEITAQHRPQDLQQVPVSVQTVDRDEVFRPGAMEVSDLVHVAPSLEIGGMVFTNRLR